MDGFYEENFNDKSWSDINVPGNWEIQGFGVPIYVNASYEFVSPGYPPYWDRPNPTGSEEFNPTGTYRKEFEIPQSWIGKILSSVPMEQGQLTSILTANFGYDQR